MRRISSLSKIILLASQVSAAGWGDSYFGGFNNNNCYEFGGTLDDSIYYGQDAGSAAYNYGGGCGAAGCTLGQDYSPVQTDYPTGQGACPIGDRPNIVLSEFETSNAYYTPAPQAACGTAMSGGYAPAPAQTWSAPAAQTWSAPAAVPCGQTTPITMLLDGNIPVEMRPSTVTVGTTTFPLQSQGSNPARPADVGALVVSNLHTQEEIAASTAGAVAGVTAAQLKKDQEAASKKKDGKKKGKGAAGDKKKCPPKKKNGVAGVTTLVALALLPLVAVLL
ncbi:hypothetical protein NEDG_00576 [Nematocida displodere]|uniref:Uncharacterized protein n=1 Tax=Nematocida displodere TaxID=1805483 RepID=A0A177EBW0_9MICR|nr:hypothetical protein NEDG_00576 [Nematocida displodere]